jgi:hypothetical protein
MQPDAQLDLTENRIQKRNWGDRILGSARILVVDKGLTQGCVFVLSGLIFKFNFDRGIPSLAAPNQRNGCSKPALLNQAPLNR